MNEGAIHKIITARGNLEMILKEAGIVRSDYNLPTRKREIVDYRQAIMSFSNLQMELSVSRSGLLFVKDHSTVTHSNNLIRADIDLLKKTPNMQITKRLELYLKLVSIKNKSAK